MNIYTIKNIEIKDFDYPLPDERIARHPLLQRDECKLLVSLNPGEIYHHTFGTLPELLPAHSLLVRNNTRVINARIKFRKPTGSEIEVFLLEPREPEDYVLMFQSKGKCRWSCMIGNLKRWKSGTLSKEIKLDGRDVTLTAERFEALEGNSHVVEFRWDDPDVTFASVVEAAGYIPIPPYLKRASEACDADDYQTVYARIEGSVAAPTAGLHFTPELFSKLTDNGVTTESVTLHVGAGTFQPVKSDAIGEHPMHTEVFSIERGMLASLIHSLKNGVPVTAVGTTTVRTLESLPILGMHIRDGRKDMTVSQWEAYDIAETSMADTVAALEAIVAYMDTEGEDSLSASTSIMIAPGFNWRIVNYIVTNFHQPQSTLLLLVSSFLGKEVDGSERWRNIYREALDNDYRFLSYGDACLFKRP